MHLRRHQPDLTCNFQHPRLRLFAQMALGSLLRLIQFVETAIRRELAALSREKLRLTRIRELQGFSDRQLRDIGVERSDIAATVEEILDRKKRPT